MTNEKTQAVGAPLERHVRPADPERADFAQRCALGENCLPVAEYRAWLERLHTDMLAEIARLNETLKRQDKAHHAEVQEQVAAERERCAKLCEQYAWLQDEGSPARSNFRNCAATIRAGA